MKVKRVLGRNKINKTFCCRWSVFCFFNYDLNEENPLVGVASNQTKVNSFCIYEQIVQTQGVCANTQMTNYPSSALTLISVLYHGSWTFSKKCSLPEY